MNNAEVEHILWTHSLCKCFDVELWENGLISSPPQFYVCTFYFWKKKMWTLTRNYFYILPTHTETILCRGLFWWCEKNQTDEDNNKSSSSSTTNTLNKRILRASPHIFTTNPKNLITVWLLFIVVVWDICCSSFFHLYSAWFMWNKRETSRCQLHMPLTLLIWLKIEQVNS